MRGIQALRRSIKGEKDKPSSASFSHKSALAIVPPKKVSLPISISCEPGEPTAALSSTDRAKRGLPPLRNCVTGQGAYTFSLFVAGHPRPLRL